MCGLGRSHGDGEVKSAAGAEMGCGFVAEPAAWTWRAIKRSEPTTLPHGDCSLSGLECLCGLLRLDFRRNILRANDPALSSSCVEGCSRVSRGASAGGGLSGSSIIGRAHNFHHGSGLPRRTLIGGGSLASRSPSTPVPSELSHRCRRVRGPHQHWQSVWTDRRWPVRARARASARVWTRRRATVFSEESLESSSSLAGSGAGGVHGGTPANSR